MYKEIRERVFHANMKLPQYNLVTFTWGNVSEIDREREIVAIKPSGVAYEKMTVNDIVIVSLDGRILDGEYKPSSDTPTHLEIYKVLPRIGGIVHTHSTYATIWAQSGCSIPCFGTTHADYFYGEIPCTRRLSRQEIDGDYEKNTGKLILETFKNRDMLAVPGVLCNNHGPFTFGASAEKAVENAVVLEEVARMSLFTKVVNPQIESVSSTILDKHYYRKHGINAYYGQS
jgi:L-ribulose-5-phosphate 4-epimerase